MRKESWVQSPVTWLFLVCAWSWMCVCARVCTACGRSVFEKSIPVSGLARGKCYLYPRCSYVHATHSEDNRTSHMATCAFFLSVSCLSRTHTARPSLQRSQREANLHPERCFVSCLPLMSGSVFGCKGDRVWVFCVCACVCVWEVLSMSLFADAGCTHLLSKTSVTGG